MTTESSAGGHHHDDNRSKSRRALLIALLVLSALMVAEALAGLLTNSLALLSDAGHLLSDVGAIGLALLAQKIARWPATSRRSYGYLRVEIIAAWINGLTIVGIALFVAVEAIERLSAPPEVEGLPMLIVASIGLVGQAITAVALARGREESLNVKGAYLHAMTDAVQSLGAVAAGVLILTTGLVIVDPIVSVLIALFILLSGARIILDASNVLLEGTPDDVDSEALIKALKEEEAVDAVSDVHLWSLTTGYNVLSAHIVTVEGSTADDREALRARLLRRLSEDHNVQHVTLQVEAGCECNKEPCSGDGARTAG